MSSTAANWLYIVCAMGALALFFLLPQRRPRTLTGIALGVTALLAWLLVLALRASASGTTLYFFLFAGLAVAAAVRVITHTRPVYSALYFILVIVSAAALLVLMKAEFLAAAVIIIYAGAILVTYLFVIMLAQQSGAPVYDRASREPFWSVAAGFLFLAAAGGRIGELPPTAVERTVPVAFEETRTPTISGNTAAVGASLMTTYIVGVELAGLLLLISMIGAIALARKRLPVESPPLSVDIGRAGKEVRPF